MVSLITAPHHFFNSHHSLVHLNFPVISSLVLVINPSRRRRQQAVSFNLLVAKESCSSSALADLRRSSYGSSWCCWCKGWESDGDAALEAEILEFMKNSEKPDMFPTKKELLGAGRMDLVEAIRKKGGWLSLGWHSDDDDEEQKVREGVFMTRDCDTGEVGGAGDIGDFQRRLEICRESNSFEGAEVGCSGVPSVSINSSQSVSSSGRPLEMEAEEDTGIEGILNRLEKQRNLSFGINLGKNGYSTCASSKDDGDSTHFGTTSDVDRADLEKNSRLASGSSNKGIFNNSGGKLSHDASVSDLDGATNSCKPEMWRTWSIRRAGFSDTEFEAAEISFNENRMEGKKEASKDEMLAITEGTTEALDRQTEINHNQIRARLQHLELELATALRLLRSKSEQLISKEGHESSSSDLRKLSDAWEFQENEFMTAQDRLRSIRAKLAVVEGKMALAIIDAQKIVEEKQRRIDGARRALQLLCTARIVWPNSASEVLLAGSFDGWTTQRKMEKSSTGIFSVCLKLYPGKYEIKFIVDGIWRIDPLRPIVHNNGYENNLLIIT